MVVAVLTLQQHLKAAAAPPNLQRKVAAARLTPQQHQEVVPALTNVTVKKDFAFAAPLAHKAAIIRRYFDGDRNFQNDAAHHQIRACSRMEDCWKAKYMTKVRERSRED